MKIALLTLHKQNNNFGTVLQARSLYSYLQEIGYEPVLIDYCPYYMNGASSWKAAIKKIVANGINLPFYLKRNKRFSDFVSQQKMTRRYKDCTQLRIDPPQADIYMIGSDQVWNESYLCGRDPAYYFDYVDSPRKMSYAASVGREFESLEDAKHLMNNIRDFKYISFRERKSAQQMQEVGLERAQYVLDPVFLHSKEYYSNWEHDVNRKGYILTYIMGKDRLLSNAAEQLSRKTNKPIIELGGFRSKCKSDYYDKAAGPCEFLSYLRNADYVLTSSFHGTAFSLIYQKQFVCVLPGKNTLRPMNILESSGTTNRILYSGSSVFDIVNNVIDYSAVEMKLNPLINSSKQYLLESLKQLSKI